MGAFVMSLARLYKNGSINKTKLNSFLKAGKITQDELDYIVAYKES